MEESEAKKKLLAGVADLWPAAKGSVREYQQKCTKKDCPRCQSGEGHPVWQLTYYDNGKQRSKHIPRPLIGEVKTGTGKRAKAGGLAGTGWIGNILRN